MKNNKSNCCKAPIHAVAEDEGTCYYVCDSCKRACDPDDDTPLTCSKHARILIGKSYCIDCSEGQNLDVTIKPMKDLLGQLVDIIEQSHDKILGTYDFDTIAKRVINLIKKMTRFPSGLEDLTEKPCRICGNLIKRDDYLPYYQWESKKYCSDKCRHIGGVIRLVEKAGYEVKKITRG